MKALIIEDDTIYQRKFIEVLRLQNIPADLCIGAYTASELIEEHNYDFIILDLRLAENTTGADVLDFLDKSKNYIPILIISEHIKAYQHLLLPYFSNDKFIISEIDKELPEIKLANAIKTFIDILECRDLRLVKFPEVVTELEKQKSNVLELSGKITALEEQNINNFDFSKELKTWVKMGLAKQGKYIVAGILSVLGLIISLITNNPPDKAINSLLMVISEMIK
jgi:CheY-like chemotaxis protein